MTPSPSAAPTRHLTDEQELIAGANAVFGVLELIVETPCSRDTQQNVLAATRGAHARLAELGFAREDLIPSHVREEQTRRAGRSGRPLRSGLVIHLPIRR
jgi:hypothetical protein